MTKLQARKLKFENKTQTLFIELELQPKKKNQVVFSASGSWYDKHMITDRHMISGGQCLDCIPKFVKTMTNKRDKKTLLKIYNLWKKYHLNDMHADCIHDINKNDIKNIKIYEYYFKGRFYKLDEQLKLLENNKYLKENIKINKQIKTYKKYHYSFKCEYKPSQLSKTIRQLYELKNVEIKSTGWVNYNKELTPSGVLCKPCPVCGYEYGTSWNYRPIPKNDLNKIKYLINSYKVVK